MRPAVVEKKSRTDDASARNEPSCFAKASTPDAKIDAGARLETAVDRHAGDHGEHVEPVVDPRLGDLGSDEPARAVEHDLHRASEDLGAFHGPPRPEQCLGGARWNRCDQVDLRKRFAPTQQRWGNRSADHPDILCRCCGRPDRIVAGDHHASAPALEHVDALVARHEVETQRDRPIDQSGAVEARPHGPLAFGSARQPA